MSFRIGLELMNSFTFCLSEKFFISFSVLTHNFAGKNPSFSLSAF